MRRTGRWHGSLTALLAGGVLLSACTSASDSNTGPAAETHDSPLEAAAEECDAGRVADSGQTLIVSTKGEEDISGDSMDDLACLLLALDTPTAVIEHMSTTRALDGMQTTNWDEVDARWTYHPDSGMNLTMTLTD